MITFPDYPEFRPTLTPRQIFEAGAFGGTYWRKINSRVTGKTYFDEYKKFPFLADLPKEILALDWKDYNVSLNKYQVKVGMSLEYWENHGWIYKDAPYGWVQWYCQFYQGRRCPDDARQIKRWAGIAGENGRFRKQLDSEIKKNSSKVPKLRQILLHWAYE